MAEQPENKTREQRMTEPFERAASISVSDIDQDNRRVKLTFASEQPVERWDWDGAYNEVLRMTPESVDLERMNDAGALLSDHDRTKQIGVVEKAWVGDDRRAHAIVRFSERPDADWEFKDVQSGIRRNVSFAYKIHEFETVRGTKGQKDTVTATKTEVLEISLVSIPADKSIGVGRSEPEQVSVEEPVAEPVREVEEKPKERVVTVMEKEQEPVNQFAREDSIFEFAKRFGVEERVARTFAADTKKTVDDLREYVSENLRAMATQETVPATPVTEIGLTEKETQRYSIAKAIMGSIDPKLREAAAFEFECHDAIEARGVRPQQGGFFVPAEVQKRTDLSVGGGLTLGGALVGTDHMPESFIELLRTNMKTRELGITIMSGLTGNPSIPRQDTAGTHYWIAEGAAPTESNLTTGQLGLSPKTIGAVQEFTRQLLVQSSPSVDRLVMSDIAAVLGRGIDLAVIDGSGEAGQPRGVLNTTGVDEMTQIGTVFSFADAVAFETAVAEDNALLETPAWLTRPSVIGALKTIEKNSAGATYLVENGQLNGYAIHGSTQMPANTLIYGDWSQVILAEWGVLEIIANDRGTTFRSGNIEVRGLHMVDVQVRYPQALKKLEAFVGVESSS
jgi:HK97 family phage major capsid protein